MHVVGAGAQQTTADHIGHRQDVAVEMHGRLRLARGPRGEGQQADVLDRGLQVDEGRRLDGHPALERAVTERQQPPLLERIGHRRAEFGHQPVVAQRVADLRFRADLRQFVGAQHRHRRHRHRTDLHHGEPGRRQHQAVVSPQQYAVARHDAEVVDEDVGDPVGLLEQLRVGPLTGIGAQRDRVAMALADRIAEQHRGAVQLRRVTQLRQIEGHHGPLGARRQAARREIVDVGRPARLRRHRDILHDSILR